MISHHTVNSEANAHGSAGDIDDYHTHVNTRKCVIRETNPSSSMKVVHRLRTIMDTHDVCAFVYIRHVLT